MPCTLVLLPVLCALCGLTAVFRLLRSLLLSPVKYLGKYRKQQGTAGEKEDKERRHIQRKMFDMHLQPGLLIFRPFFPGVATLHEQMHEAVYASSLVQDQCPVLLDEFS